MYKLRKPETEKVKLCLEFQLLTELPTLSINIFFIHLIYV